MSNYVQWNFVEVEVEIKDPAGLRKFVEAIRKGKYNKKNQNISGLATLVQTFTNESTIKETETEKRVKKVTFFSGFEYGDGDNRISHMSPGDPLVDFFLKELSKFMSRKLTFIVFGEDWPVLEKGYAWLVEVENGQLTITDLQLKPVSE